MFFNPGMPVIEDDSCLAEKEKSSVKKLEACFRTRFIFTRNLFFQFLSVFEHFHT